MSHTYIGIDLGTSSLKIIAMDEEHHVTASASGRYENRISGSYCETDPEIWNECLRKTLPKVLDQIDRSQVCAIGITGQLHTTVFLDSSGHSIRPAILWNDTRTKDLIPEMRERMSHFHGGSYLARSVSTGSPSAALYWLRKNEPGNFARLARFLIAPDYLVYTLTGRLCSDYTEASTSCLLDIDRRSWSEEVRQFIGLEKEMYPELLGSAETAGTLTQEMAELFGLPDGITVTAAIGDNPATAVATGCIDAHFPVISLGTSGVFLFAADDISDGQTGKIILFSPDGRHFHYLIQGAVQSMGSTINWWTEKMMGMKPSEIEGMTRPLLKKDSRLLFYPHIMGDKTLYQDPDLRGAFINISVDDTKADFMYAVMEGLSFAFRELADKMKLDVSSLSSIKVMGGGASNHVWMQILANVFQKKIEQLDRSVCPALGAAMLAESAAGGTGIYAGAQSSPAEKETEGRMDEQMAQLPGTQNNLAEVRQVFYPQPERTAYFNRKYQQYLRIHDALKIIDGDMNSF